MLFVHEVHRVRGRQEEAFEAAYRDELMPALAKEDDARLLWYCNHAHGSGPAYNVVTITAVRDGAAWERLADRMQRGDLRPLLRQIDEMRHGATAKLVRPVEWSPLQEVDFADVPVTAEEHGLTIYMEDTGWPQAALDDYVGFWGETYYPMLTSRPPAERLLDIEVVFEPAFGAGRRKEAILMQKVVDPARLHFLLTTETAPAYKAPGTFMHEALNYRDEWESKLLRTSSWSPRW
ncbi:MAG TPA: hypothetical protein VFB78_01065 [Acidimicrobiales bacterium]|nr:hypothetical protein [Acidimicrobiales bacterium]